MIATLEEGEQRGGDGRLTARGGNSSYTSLYRCYATLQHIGSRVIEPCIDRSLHLEGIDIGRILTVFIDVGGVIVERYCYRTKLIVT